MDRHTRIISLLTEAFAPSFLELRDESAKHHGHAGANPGGQSHYDLTIISDKFSGLSKIHRHQAIYKVLDREFRDGLHALSIKALDSLPK